ncbi:MAG TPA: GNAT family N-acetyltransferase [Rhizomicrobium sp.]|jgi:GNAT superfamily N-acetyltransferase
MVFARFDAPLGITYHDAMPSSAFTIEPVRSPDDLAATKLLFEAYAASLGIDLSYQNFLDEMAAMPGKYAPPKGELLLARGADGAALGCVGLRALDDGACEMKRLYVTPEGRGLGLGRALAQRVVAEARRIGYGEMRLDTLPRLKAAIALYDDMGFVRIPAYYDTPIPGTLFFALSLRS